MADGHHSAAELVRAGAHALLGCAMLAGVAGVAGTAAGCFHGATPVEEQRSVGEQDLAGDAFKRGRLREAFDHVQRALKLNPDNGDAAYLGAMVLLGFCALDEKASDCRFKEAEAFARKAVEVSPELRDAKNALGVILVHEGRFEEAITVLNPSPKTWSTTAPRAPGATSVGRTSSAAAPARRSKH